MLSLTLNVLFGSIEHANHDIITLMWLVFHTTFPSCFVMITCRLATEEKLRDAGPQPYYSSIHSIFCLVDSFAVPELEEHHLSHQHDSQNLLALRFVMGRQYFFSKSL